MLSLSRQTIKPDIKGVNICSMIRQSLYHSQLYSGKFGFLIFTFLFFLLSGASPAFSQQQKSSFTARLINIESASSTPFRFNTTLHNAKGVAVVFQLRADVPIGWIATFNAEGSQVSALRVDSGKTENISIELNAAPSTKPGKYVVPVNAISGSDTLHLELEAVVKGDYKMELTTPTGRLSDNVTEGTNKQIQLVLKNTGTLPLKQIELSGQSPSNWTSTFEPSKIDQLDPQQTKEISATIHVPNKTIAGDYMTTFTARNTNTNSDAAFRITVATSLLSGWVGIVVILIALGIVYLLIRKYGRR